MIWLTYFKSHSHTMPPSIYSKILTPPRSFLRTSQLRFQIAQKCLGDDYNDITYNYTYLYDMRIGLDFQFFA